MRLALSAALLLGAAAVPAHAQAKLSEPAVVSQTVDGTRITLEYGRPSIRGRTRIFPDEVHWEEVWTPGANNATTLEVDRDVTIEGRAVPKGKYSVWLVVKEQGDWTLLLSSEAKLWHTVRPKPEQEFARIPVAPQWGGEAVETLAWDFPVVKPDRAVMRMRWANVAVSLRVATAPSRVLTAEQRARVLGTWALARDSSAAAARQPPRAALRVWDEDGRLRARITPALAGYESAFDLFAAGSSTFFPIYYDRDGRPRGAETDLSLRFEFDDGKVRSIELVDVEWNAILKGPAK